MFHLHLSVFSRTKALEYEIDRFHDKLIDASMTFSKAVSAYLKEGRSENFQKISRKIKKIEHEADALRRSLLRSNQRNSAGNKPHPASLL